MGIMKPINTIYNRRESKINEETIDDMIILFKQKFPASIWIADAIRCLLQRDPKLRFDFIH